VETRAFPGAETPGSNLFENGSGDGGDVQADDDGVTHTDVVTTGIVDGHTTPQWLVLTISVVASSPGHLFGALKYKQSQT